jgi:SAM-dependent methyltransferase
MRKKDITRANRKAWNQATTVHQKARSDSLKNLFRQKGYSTLDDLITALLKDLGLVGKKVAQLCCNNGRETLSLVNLGAEKAVGFDISDEAIKEARELAEISGLNCEFVRSDVYDIGEEYHNQFDLIYISIGALSWLPDLDRFYGIVAALLKSKGLLVVYEMHPFTYLLAAEDEEGFDPGNPMKITYSYYRSEPWIAENGMDYVGKSKYKAHTSYSFTQKISDLINPLAANGINIREFNEYSHDISALFDFLGEQKMIPLSYIMVAEKV